MPYKHEHAVRLNEPSKYVSFRRENNKFGDGISAIWGIFERDNKKVTELQALRFDATKYTISEVRTWVEKHDMKPISIEEASGKTEEKSIETTQIVDNQEVSANSTTIPEKVNEIVEDVEKIIDDVKEVVDDGKKLVEQVIEDVKPVVERYVRLVSKPEEEIKKEIAKNLILKKQGKLL